MKRAEPATVDPLADLPEPVRMLFPMLANMGGKVNFDLRQGNVSALLRSVGDLTQAEQFTQIPELSNASDQLLKEATELAWQQRDPEALRRSLQLWSNPVRAGRSQDEIQETSERLEEVERERKEMLTKPRARVIFHNKTDRELEVYVNRKPIGTLGAGKRHEVGELLAGRQYLGANDETLQWGPRKVYVGPGEVFNWRLFD